MELEEIIKPYSLAPEEAKRKGGESTDFSTSSAKRHHVEASTGAGDGHTSVASGKVSLDDLPDEIDSETVEKILEQADEVHVEEITEHTIKRCMAQLERRIKKNQHDRIKFASNPEKWIKSEVDLDEEVKRWTQIAASPSLFPHLFESGAFALLVSLLTHANSDLAIDVVEVFSELTEADSVMEAPDPPATVQQFVEGQLPEMVVDLLCRLKEDGSEDDALGISSCLSVVENLLELQPSLASSFAQMQKLPAFLFKRIRPVPQQQGAVPPTGPVSFVADGARLHAAEVLAALLQQLQPSEKEQLGGRSGADGVDRLLRAVAPYRKKDPESSQEEELVLNLFDCLCSLLLVDSNRELFGKQQGVDLMLRIVKERRFFTPQAVKALDFALMNSASNCATFVEKLGLRFLFSLFLGKVKEGRYKPKKRDEHIEHVVSIINSLLKECTGTHTARVLNKFQESGFEKVERLLELRETYAARSEKARKKPVEETELDELDKELGVDSEERRYLDACEAGLSVLQHIDSIIVRLTNAGNALVRLRLMDLMQMKGIDPGDVEKIIRELADHMDENAASQKGEILTSLDNFKAAWDESDGEESAEEEA